MAKKSMGQARKLALVSLMVAAVIGMIYLSARPPTQFSTTHSPSPPAITPHHADSSYDSAILAGPAIASKLGNETAKAELGRAAWKLFHTTLARFPDTPSAEESRMLKDYIYLFQRLYPCGECAEHFGQLLKKYPPQVSTRSAAAVWGCHVHNEVNKSLKKELFDCANIGDFYDCGCADDVEDESGVKAKAVDSEVRTGSGKPEMSEEAKEKYRTNGRELDYELLNGGRPAGLKKEG